MGRDGAAFVNEFFRFSTASESFVVLLHLGCEICDVIHINEEFFNATADLRSFASAPSAVEIDKRQNENSLHNSESKHRKGGEI